MKKVLFVATVAKTHICVFHLRFLKMFKDWGYEVHVAARNDFGEEPCEIPCCDVFHEIPFERSPLKPSNIRAYKQLRHIIETERFELIHCHTPVGGVLTRLAARKARKHGTKVLYTAHGFHFYKGAPFKNWLLYYPAEKICARYTDTLITINREDYELAKKKLHARRVEHVPGVGVDVQKIKSTQVDKTVKRRELGVPEAAFLLVSVGELNRNKNHEVVLRAIANLKDKNLHYVIAGRGELHTFLETLAKDLGIESQIHLLGYRADVAEIYRAADVCVFPSMREGLPVAVIEAIASGLPVVAADNRGTRECVLEGQSGYLIPFANACLMAEKISFLLMSPNDRAAMGVEGAKLSEKYDKAIIDADMKRIYEEHLQ